MVELWCRREGTNGSIIGDLPPTDECIGWKKTNMKGVHKLNIAVYNIPDIYSYRSKCLVYCVRPKEADHGDVNYWMRWRNPAFQKNLDFLALTHRIGGLRGLLSHSRWHCQDPDGVDVTPGTRVLLTSCKSTWQRGGVGWTQSQLTFLFWDQ